jgi:hypothetical protein
MAKIKTLEEVLASIQRGEDGLQSAGESTFVNEKDKEGNQLYQEEVSTQGKSDADWLKDSYRDILGRDNLAYEGSKAKDFATALAGGASRDDIKDRMIKGREYQTRDYGVRAYKKAQGTEEGPSEEWLDKRAGAGGFLDDFSRTNLGLGRTSNQVVNAKDPNPGGGLVTDPITGRTKDEFGLDATELLNFEKGDTQSQDVKTFLDNFKTNQTAGTQSTTATEGGTATFTYPNEEAEAYKIATQANDPGRALKSNYATPEDELKATYQEILGRNPLDSQDTQGNLHLSRLKAGGDINQIRKELVASPEYQARDASIKAIGSKFGGQMPEEDLIDELVGPGGFKGGVASFNKLKERLKNLNQSNDQNQLYNLTGSLN